jgi:hypothetical protein
MRRFWLALLSATALTIGTTVLPAAAKPSADPAVTVVTTGLANPRGLAFGPSGGLLVAEAGSGGTFDVGGGNFAGTTSRISAVNLGGALPAAAQPFVTGLISIASQDGSFATGVDGLSVQGGRILGIITGAHQFVDGPSAKLSSKKASPDLIQTARAQLGRLIKANPGGQWKAVGDVGGTDFNYTLNCQSATPACDPNSDFPDANPYGVLALPGRTYVVDAGSNTLDVVNANGTVQILAYFHDPGQTFTELNDEVPTCLTQTGGQLYIGDLNGRVWRWDGTNLQPVTLNVPPGPPIVGIGGCTSDPAGNLYLSDQFGGAVWKVAPDGTATVLATVNDPSGIALGPDGNLYVSVNSTDPANGQVIRFHP